MTAIPVEIMRLCSDNETIGQRLDKRSNLRVAQELRSSGCQLRDGVRMLKRLRQRYQDRDLTTLDGEQESSEGTSNQNASHSGPRTLNEFEPDTEQDDEQDDDEEVEEDFDPPSSWFDRDSVAFLASVGAHILVIVALGSITIATQPKLLSLLLNSEPIAEELAPIDVVTDIAYSDTPSDEFGADSIGSVDMALSSAPILADVSAVEAVDLDITIPDGDVNVTFTVEKAVGLTESPKSVRGMTGVGTTGTDGAVDRVTYEILQSLEERPTLVVWIFDSSISMVKRRQEISDRFERIYKQLGIVQAEKDKREGAVEVPPLLTSVLSFGSEVEVLTKQPTEDLSEIRTAIEKIGNEGGDEMVFHAIKTAVEKYKSYRVAKGNSPARNVMFLVVTDERGDDLQLADETIKACRFQTIPCYVLGVPAPFGRDKSFIKFVEFDPAYAQVEDWAEVDQGPETLYPERVKLGYQDSYMEEPVLDSGFGPYALSKLCYETGGIYFSIHPNRKLNAKVDRKDTEAFASQMSYFFDPDTMDRYRPDYLSDAEYMTRVKKSPLRYALINAAQLSRAGTLSKPRMVFIKRDEASFTKELTDSQLESARLYPELSEMCSILGEGEKFRGKETSPRWLASFELSYGTAMAAKIRAESYNAMLAKAKRGMSFTKPESNTWNLRPSEKVTVDSKLEKEAKLAKELLQSVVEKHTGTPWGILAGRELDNPIGWEWVESMTDLNPPARNNANRNPPPPNTPPMPEDEKAKMLKTPPPKRAIKKV